jgi:hypothetical protein
MAEYLVKVSFWLRAHDSVTIDATDDAAAVEKARAAAIIMMEGRAQPETIDTDERRQGVIAYIDRLDRSDRVEIAEDVAFDGDRIDAPFCHEQT